ncbi:hypothetical protein GCM10011374_36860 [Kocuria dechangensis]|uniref:Uncharacterized protein n=1 Tax=Kocuria dechangensis TaxID=1176249 RepID=A0A917M1E1_9MICC|nr:hypothetical protein [Kocuria dechangensis]GGG69060.1 hypothetical protein GCM10011374_36860 [Kocuria dechangensis]
MPIVLWCIIETVGDLVHALIPPVEDSHPLSCHGPRLADANVFDKLVQILLLGAAYRMVADTTWLATLIYHRFKEWTPQTS